MFVRGWANVEYTNKQKIKLKTRIDKNLEKTIYLEFDIIIIIIEYEWINEFTLFVLMRCFKWEQLF